MGRVLTPERRQAAIIFWRERLLPLRSIAPKAVPAELTRLLDVGVNVADPDALKDLRRALRSIAQGNETEIETWIGQYLVDRGPHLLIREDQRNAVLTHIRDIERRARRKADGHATVTIKLKAETAEELTTFVERHRLPTRDAGVASLLRGSAKRPKTGSKAAQSGNMEADLFAALADTPD